MSLLKLDYPVYSLDRRLLLRAGTTLTDAALEALITSRGTEHRKTYTLLQYGTVKQDIMALLGQPPVSTIISDEKQFTDVMNIMEQVKLGLPVLESIEYFKNHDFYTYRHILVVFALSTLISIHLISDYRVRVKESATGPTHDFGKICIPVSVLRKTTPLTRDERKILKHHTTAGYILLSHYLRDTEHLAVRVAKDHHERNNGSGYPGGINLNDRAVEIVAVCDIYDALSASRPYRPISFDNRSALEEITLMAERGDVSWEVVQALVAQNRKGKPHFSECSVSLEKRGVPPPGNLYGVIAENVSTAPA
jgi:HD-GYP domain-containing protein (c-di-GMP phosphodiesterase class II)